ncbi:aspergillopepsin [Fusarium heterosporum]|uniref:Aspergillopepsin n=1 Tax=Fusarium heterosporum TaxID=42747 RepID=A0A8H5T9X1_FUSHE|nr:aspergillopepsin [Fusarium heterosporum]
MKGGSSLILASTLLSWVNALNLHKRHDAAVVSVDFAKQSKRHVSLFGKRDEADVVEVDTSHPPGRLLYWANFTIGTPSQKQTAMLDTGSTDLILITDNLESCKKEGACTGPLFSPDKSKTFQEFDEQASGSYGDGTAFQGYYANDTFSFGDTALEQFKFIATTEYTSQVTLRSIFGSIMDGDDVGQFLFGGVNKAKYAGPLVTFPIPVDNQSNRRDRTLVLMEGFGTTSNGESSTFEFEPRPVLLDSGTYLSILTADMLLHVVEHLDVSIDEHHGAVAPCKGDKSNETLDFTFGELTFNVPFTRFLLDITPEVGVDGVSYCKVNYNEHATNIVLGDDFLQSAYVVYDYYNMEISLAKYNPDGGEDDIYEITRDVPGASPAEDIPLSFLGYDQPSMPDPTEVPSGVESIIATSLAATTTAAPTGSTSTGSATAAITDTADEDKDNDANFNNPAHVWYMLVGTLCLAAMV